MYGIKELDNEKILFFQNFCCGTSLSLAVSAQRHYSRSSSVHRTDRPSVRPSVHRPPSVDRPSFVLLTCGKVIS